jgi:hypothetical protein
MSKLTFRYQYDATFFDPKRPTDDFGRLSINVETDRFSGKRGFLGLVAKRKEIWRGSDLSHYDRSSSNRSPMGL